MGFTWALTVVSSLQEACLRWWAQGLLTYTALLKHVEKEYPGSQILSEARYYSGLLIPLIKEKVGLRCCMLVSVLTPSGALPLFLCNCFHFFIILVITSSGRIIRILNLSKSSNTTLWKCSIASKSLASCYIIKYYTIGSLLLMRLCVSCVLLSSLAKVELILPTLSRLTMLFIL